MNSIMESVFFMLAVIVICFTVFKIFDGITDLKREGLYLSCDIEEGWEPPVIPSCDQELWERIKDRCKGETDDKD